MKRILNKKKLTKKFERAIINCYKSSNREKVEKVLLYTKKYFDSKNKKTTKTTLKYRELNEIIRLAESRAKEKLKITDEEKHLCWLSYKDIKRISEHKYPFHQYDWSLKICTSKTGPKYFNSFYSALTYDKKDEKDFINRNIVKTETLRKAKEEAQNQYLNYNLKQKQIEFNTEFNQFKNNLRWEGQATYNDIRYKHSPKVSFKKHAYAYEGYFKIYAKPMTSVSDLRIITMIEENIKSGELSFEWYFFMKQYNYNIKKGIQIRNERKEREMRALTQTVLSPEEAIEDSSEK